MAQQGQPTKKTENRRPPKGRAFADAPVEVTERVGPRHRRRQSLSTLALIAVGSVVLAGVLLAVFLSTVGRQSEQTEDPLVLYQVAKELSESGEDTAALETLARARRATSYPRALKQLQELEQQILAAPKLKRAQQLIADKDYAPAKSILDGVLENNPANKGALKLLALIPEAPEAVAAADARAPDAAESAAGVAAADLPRVAPRRAAVAASASKRSRRRAASRRRQAPSQRAMVRRGTVYVDSTVAGYVIVDGTQIARTPAVLSLTPGPHAVEVKSLMDPTMRVHKRIVVVAGTSARVMFEVPLPPPVASEASSLSAEQEASRRVRKSMDKTKASDERRTLPPSDNLNPWAR